MANTLSPDEKDVYKIVRAVRDLFEGRSNAVGSFTLTPNASSTTVTAPNCGAGSTVLAFAKTANAAAEIGNGTMYIGTVSNGSFVVTHANNAQPHRPFLYFPLGGGRSARPRESGDPSARLRASFDALWATVRGSGPRWSLPPRRRGRE